MLAPKLGHPTSPHPHPHAHPSVIQKYFPTTCAQDSGNGNVQGGYTYQGRVQLTLADQFVSAGHPTHPPTHPSPTA